MYLFTPLVAWDTRRFAASLPGPAICGRPLAPTREDRVSLDVTQAPEQTGRRSQDHAQNVVIQFEAFLSSLPFLLTSFKLQSK